MGHPLAYDDLTGHEYDLVALKLRSDPLTVLAANRRRGLAGLQWIAARREHGNEAKWSTFDAMSLTDIMRDRAAAAGVDLDDEDSDSDEPTADEAGATSWETAADAAETLAGEPVDPTEAGG